MIHEQNPYDIPSNEANLFLPGSFSLKKARLELQQQQERRDAIVKEAKARQETYGRLTLRTSNDWIKEGETIDDPVPMFDCYWNEGEISCLFADSNVGKSILAQQVAYDLTCNNVDRPVIYYDFEMSTKQYQMRYRATDGKSTFTFPENLYRVELNPDLLDPGSEMEEDIIHDIEASCLANACFHIIIDNLVALTTKSQDGEFALKFMARLRRLKIKYGMSILVLAHTPKRDQSQPITDNDLAGSKNLFNLFDSIFAMNKTTAHPDWRYLKQLKVRCGALQNGADHVEVMAIEKQPDGFLGLRHVKYDHEDKLLRKRSKQEQIQRARQLANEGMTQLQIAEELNVNKSTISRWLSSDE